MSYLVLGYFITAVPENGKFLILAFLRLDPFLSVQQSQKFLKRHTVVSEKAKREYRHGYQDNQPADNIISEEVLSEDVQRNADGESSHSAYALPYRQPEQKFLLVFGDFFRYLYFYQVIFLLTMSRLSALPMYRNSLLRYPASALL